jgi:hypothetical protein
VITITGQVILEQTHYQKETLGLEVTETKGLHFVTIQTGKGTKTIKVLNQ